MNLDVFKNNSYSVYNFLIYAFNYISAFDASKFSVLFPFRHFSYYSPVNSLAVHSSI